MNKLGVRGRRIAAAGLAAAALTVGGAAVATSAMADTARVDAAGMTWPVLQKGAAGANVKTAQYLLDCNNFKGYIKVNADGAFGSRTAASVTAFQKNVHVKPYDGIIGAKTWPRLVHTVQKSGGYAMDTPDCVKGAQVLLNKHGYKSVKVNGTFDKATDSAVRDYQKKKMHIKKPDGIVTLKVWQSLIGS